MLLPFLFFSFSHDLLGLQAQHVGRKLESADGVADVERQFFPFVAHLTDDSSYALRVLRTIYSRLSPFREIAE